MVNGFIDHPDSARISPLATATFPVCYNNTRMREEGQQLRGGKCAVPEEFKHFKHFTTEWEECHSA